MSETECVPNIVVNTRNCKGCGLCVKVCANNVLKLSTKLNEKGYSLPEAIQPGACVKCHKCVFICPDLAIDVFDYSSEGLK
jgi:2-oxoglutarate ferredoxin oxidoreductase subunit delta